MPGWRRGNQRGLPGWQQQYGPLPENGESSALSGDLPPSVLVQFTQPVLCFLVGWVAVDGGHVAEEGELVQPAHSDHTT